MFSNSQFHRNESIGEPLGARGTEIDCEDCFTNNDALEGRKDLFPEAEDNKEDDVDGFTILETVLQHNFLELKEQELHNCK